MLSRLPQHPQAQRIHQTFADLMKCVFCTNKLKCDVVFTCHDCNIVYKRCYFEEEREIHRDLAILDIAPKIVYESESITGMQKYEMTLSEYEECNGYYKTSELYEDIDRMIRRMHQAGIIHGDLHNQNIVLTSSSSTIDIRLIDFGQSIYIESIESDHDFLKIMSEFWNEELCNLQDLVNYEFKMYKSSPPISKGKKDDKGKKDKYDCSSDDSDSDSDSE